MSESKDILAKSEENGRLSLLEHTRYVAEMIEVISEGFLFPFDKSLAVKGAILHDLGKAHPHFQKRIKGYRPLSLIEKRRFDNFKYRHEISSLAFLPAFPKEEWDVLIEMVVAHHKSIENDKSKKGIIDFENWSKNNQWIDEHLSNWDSWQPSGWKILKSYNIHYKNITLKEAKEALQYSLQYCQNIGFGWSEWRGVLKAADHYASAFNDKYVDRLEPLFKIPDLSFYKNSSRRSEFYPLSLVDTHDARKHTIVVAPTGAGKTDFLLKRTKGRIFYTLPFQASINAMYDRFRNTIEPKEGIRLQHGTSKITVGDNFDEELEQSLVGSSVKVLTPYQLAGIIFGVKNFESIILDIQGSDVILDEIHTYNDLSQSMVLEIVKALIHFDCCIHIGTATMPSPLYKAILEILGGKNKVYEVGLTKNELQQFNRHRIFKHNSDFASEEIQDILCKGVFDDEKVLIVFNTVKAAQNAFQKITEDERYFNVDRMLIHSRFKRKDRVALEQKLKNQFNESSKGCIVISTQVVEVSLDISFDRMITEAAPLDSLVQRFGRVNRKRSNNTIGCLKPIHVLNPKTNTLPYNREIVCKSFDLLPENGVAFQEKMLQDLMDKIYIDIKLKSIDVHLKFHNNGFQMKKLTDNPKSVLIEALEVDGATCILASDRDIYIESNWKERIGLEIPISFKTLKYYSKHYEQLNGIGSNPFVIPQGIDEYNLYGLKLVEPDIFL